MPGKPSETIERMKILTYPLVRILPAMPLLIASPILVSAPTAAMPPLEMAFDGPTVEIHNLTPGPEVVYWSVTRDSAGFAPRTVTRAERALDSDADGIVRIDRETPPPRKFLAVAVELASGRFAVLTPKDGPAREIAFPAQSLQSSRGQRLERLENDRDYVELLLVRPGVGAWGLTTGDGAVSDEGPSSDGSVVSSPLSMVPIGESGPPPEEFLKDDLLVRIAPRQMEYYALRIVR